MRLEDVLLWLEGCSDEERATVLAFLRRAHPLHNLEREIGLPAEAILDAIGQAAGLTLRMLRGVLAEAAFRHRVIAGSRWQDVTPPGDHPYDYRIDDGDGPARVQVKLQRSKEGRPMLAREALRRLPEDQFVVETWKTRAGRNAAGEGTRLYRFGEFDILAVAMQPSTGEWDSFLYTVERWLIPDDRDPARLLKLQPVARQPNDDWTDSLDVAVSWFREGGDKRIAG